MADPLRAKFHRWQVTFVVLPAAFFLLVACILLTRLLLQGTNRDITQLDVRARAFVDQVFRVEATRISTAANQPDASSMLAISQRRDSKDTRLEEVELQWTRAPRDDLLIRGVLDNDVAVAFARLGKQQPHIENMRMADMRGNLLAATDKPSRYFQNDQPWFKLGRVTPAGQVAAEPVDAFGRMSMIVGVIRPNFTNVFDGLVLAEMNLRRLFTGLRFSDRKDDLVFLIGRGVFPVVGDETAVTRAHKMLEPFLKSGLNEGWADGYRFHARPVDGGLTWRDPVTLVCAVQQARIPAGLFLMVLGALAVGGLLIAGIHQLALLLSHRHIYDPMREATEAGIWILRTAYGDEDAQRPALQQPWATALTERTSLVQRELTRWLNKWRQELLSEESSLSVELKRDLEMATEFQQAFLNRPYPVIPEVHVEGRLRLEFNHRYLPALAMGGDFFDIAQVGPDCAGILVADVMGHGTRSALIVSILRTLIAEQTRRGRNAPHFMRELNANFCAMLKTLPSPFFASAAYFVADTTSRVATYSIAGHPPPFYLHRATGRVSRLEVPKPQSAAMGLLPTEEYGAATVRLNPGDAFLFFTDGVYEVANHNGEEFGLARMEKILRTHVYRSTPEILDAIVKGIHEFAEGEPIADDICLIVVDITTEVAKRA